MSWVAIGLSVAILVTSTGLWVLFNKYDGNITRIENIFARDGNAPPAAPRNAQNILIVGSDTRGDAKAGEGFQGTGDDFVTGQRSDTVILAHLFGDSDKAQLVSFPRDSYVDIPAFTNPETGKVREAHKGKLNSAFFIGGPALLVATIENLTQIRVDGYVEINFEGFQSMVDKLGGVEVCLSKPAKEKDSGIDLPAGRQTIRGDAALAFVRQRKGLALGDIDRIRRQQAFLGSMVRKVLSSGTLLNPIKLTGFLDVATKNLKVDENMSAGDLKDLALRFREFSAGGIIFSTLPASDLAARRNRELVVLIDEEKAEELFGALREDRAPDVPKPQATTAADPLTVRPSAIRVRVFNGAGVQGLGRRAATDLEGVGFVVVGAASDRGRDATGTVVMHGPDKADSARTLAAAIPGATVQEDASLGSVLDVVVGSAYDGAKRVTVAGSAPSQTPGASAPPKVVTAQDDPCAP